MVTIYLSIGSNVSPRLNIIQSLKALEETFGVLTCSPVYRSAAVGFEGPDFLNMAVSAQTNLTVNVILELLHTIETNQGRERQGERFSSRTLDVDLLLYGEEVISNANTSLPRSEITEEAFVLKPLADIAGHMRHPLTGESFNQMLANMSIQSPEKLAALETQIDFPIPTKPARHQPQ